MIKILWGNCESRGYRKTPMKADWSNSFGPIQLSLTLHRSQLVAPEREDGTFAVTGLAKKCDGTNEYIIIIIVMKT